MSNTCEFFSTEYTRNYRRYKNKQAEIIHHKDYFQGRIEEGEIDPRTASIPSQLDEAAEHLVHKHILDNLQSVYRVSYKYPWIPGDGKERAETETKEKNLQNELVAYIRALYFDPHGEKILAPPVTAKRILGYIRPKLLHASLSMYQDTFGRTGATVIIQEQKKKQTKMETLENNEITLNIKKHSLCKDMDYED